VLHIVKVEQRAIADDDQASGERLRANAVAKLGADAGGLAGGDRDDRAPYRSSSRSST
jgi:hypothetical protein